VEPTEPEVPAKVKTETVEPEGPAKGETEAVTMSILLIR
jgi:hypothetical protein